MKTSQAILTKGKEMKSKAGVWIDHRKAVVVQMSDNGVETRQINSDVVRPLADMAIGMEVCNHSSVPLFCQWDYRRMSKDRTKEQ